MNPDDKQAILAELMAVLREKEPKWEREIAEKFATYEGEETSDEGLLFMALGYLAAKRRYEKAGVVTQPVTRMSVDEAFEEFSRDVPDVQDSRIGYFYAAWNAALANMQQGGLNIGDRVSILHDVKNERIPGMVVFRPDSGGWYDSRGLDVRPLPKTVELTDDEKLRAIFDAELVKNVLTKAGCWRKIAEARNTKTLEQLCAEYSIATTRSV